MTRILVVTGARALARASPSRLWSLRELLSRFEGVDTVAHGDCLEGPDAWAFVLARAAGIVVVAFPALGRPYIVRPDGSTRPLRDAASYVYRTPLERNAALAAWAGDMQEAGHGVRGLALRCEWPAVDGQRATQGTAHCRDRLFGALGGGNVEDLVCPREFGP